MFLPRPAVDSAVAVIDRVEAHPLAPEAIRLAAAGFGQRRKMLRSSLAGVLADPCCDARGGRGSMPPARAEDLFPSDYLRIAEVRHAG